MRTVFGLSKAYGNGWIATLIAFTRTSIPRDQLDELAPVMTMFKVATMDLMNQDRVFA